MARFDIHRWQLRWIFELGRRANRRGVGRSDCPPQYKPTSKKAWRHGWSYEERRYLVQRDRAMADLALAAVRLHRSALEALPEPSSSLPGGGGQVYRDAKGRLYVADADGMLSPLDEN